VAETLGSVLREAAEALADLPQAAPRLEAELLLAEATGLAREQLIAWPERDIDPAAAARYRDLVSRRRRGEPIAYLRGRQAFWGLELAVSADTLIPRPETELLVEVALERLPAGRPLVVLDAGTGSGAIAAALARERPAWTLIATERSAGAARVAQDNLRRYAPANTHLVRCDWLAAIAPRSLDALISNPPYVTAGDRHLSEGDLPWEPRAALVAGADGLNAIRRLAAEGRSALRPGGLLALEHGYDQGPAVRDVLARHGYDAIETRPDLAGHERVTLGFAPDLLEEKLAASERK
jgi:release factor glutamine methyltransferase